MLSRVVFINAHIYSVLYLCYEWNLFRAVKCATILDLCQALTSEFSNRLICNKLLLVVWEKMRRIMSLIPPLLTLVHFSQNNDYRLGNGGEINKHFEILFSFE